jgi:thiol-disulfide isomerase/thioredoxin
MIFLTISCKNKFKEALPTPIKWHKNETHQVPEFDFEKLSSYLNRNNDTLYVYNFWATWCEPCVAELPCFESINEKYKNKPVKVILISLDFPKKVESNLLPFLSKNNIQAEVYFLNDPDANAWIEKVNQSWSGAIPATLFKKNNTSLFFEESFFEPKLEEIIDNFLK